MRALRLYSFVAVVNVPACGGTDAPKTPLGERSAGGVTADEAPPAITGAAKLALDSGNMLFRAKEYDRALSQYRRSAQLAPDELAPLLGIMMVADVTRNSKLSEETLPRIRRLDPGVADSSARIPHSKIMQRHPPTGAIPPPRT